MDDEETAYMHMCVLCCYAEEMTAPTALELFDGLLGGLVNERDLDEDEVWAGVVRAIEDNGQEDIFLGENLGGY